MLASAINANNGNNGGASTMPGDYEQLSRAAPRIAPQRTTVLPPRASIPPRSQSKHRPPQIPRAIASNVRPPISSAVSPERRRHRSRRRSITPDIVIDRRHRHHGSSGRHRVITIPIDNRPTLGLRGAPQHVIEIERVRCRRHRKSRSLYYEDDYDIPQPVPPPLQPQSHTILGNPYLPPAQPTLMLSPNNSGASLAFLPNLTPEMIDNLPKQIIHLPPIYLPGSQADANTGLQTVIFPAEIINPIDGTLSIIQRNSTANDSRILNMQPPVTLPAQPPVINTPTNVESPLAPLAMLSGPFMQQVQDIFRRITLSATQSPLSSSHDTNVPRPLTAFPQYNAVNNSPSNPLTIPSITSTNAGSYPPANIRSSGSYNPTTSISPNSANISPYRPTTSISSSPRNITPYTPANITPYSPANIRPYLSSTTTTASNSRNITPYSPANITPYRPNTFITSNPRNITPYGLSSNTPYQSTSFTPSNLSRTRPNLTNDVSSNSAHSGPYHPANITLYNTLYDRSAASSRLTSYIPSSSLISSDSYNTVSSGIDNGPVNIPQVSQTFSQAPYQSSNPIPKSILRNTPSHTLPNTTYNRSNLSSISPPYDIVYKTTTSS